MRSLNQIARTLSGRTRLEERAELASADTYTLIGVATTDSENGSVRIRLTDSVTRAGWDEEGTDIEVPTNGHVREGQRVYVTCFGGSMQEMVVSGAVGEGDELRADVDTALSEAEVAHEAAEAAVEDAGLAKQAAQQAAGSAESAATSAANAASSASNAEADARRAEQSATSAQSSASTAATAASNAQTSAGQAASSASAAAQSASDAQGSAATAASAAQQATQDAAEALRQSGLAQTAADTAIEQSGRAETAARQATTHANSALVQLSTVEDVMGVLDWVTAHGTYVRTADTAIDATKVYYVLGDDNLYHAVAEPDVADISTYYELSIDQALSNFVASHLALTDQGLYVLKDSSSYKTLLSDTGMTVYDPTGNAVATYGESTTFATDRDWTVGSSQAFIFYDASENTLQIGGANVQIGGLAPSELAGSRIWTATADPTTPNYTFALSALTGASGTPRVGDLVVRGYYRYTVSSVASSSVLTGNRTSIRGATGAQGPQGPQGEQGPQGAAGHSPEVTSTKNADGSVTILVDGTATSTVDAGEDGHSPTVTTTKNADGSVTIYVDGTASSTVEAGTDGTSYYTYVRYSKNANGSGMVATPTAETKYIGVYTGTSASVPAYTSFNWSKYVGDDAAPLTVTATSVDYILSTSGTNPPADSASWQASPLAPTTTQYLWTRTTLTFSDGTTAKSYSVGGKVGEKGSAGPEAYVTITPSNIDWDAGTATLTATLHVDGAKVTPTKYEWAKGDTALSATGNQCGATDLNATYSCTCTWSGGKQRGTIDFAASNSVKLVAEAGFETADGKYATKTELSTSADGIRTSVAETYATKTALNTETALRKGAYATSTTAVGTAAKVATITPAVTGFSLYSGCTITVRFDKGNSAANPTLNVNGTGAKKIVVNATENPTADLVKWNAYQTCIFTYDGSYWRFIGSDGETVRLKNAETTIEQTANNVLIKATESDTTAAQGGQHLIQSLINVAPEGVKIAADKVNIEGAAIFTSGRLSSTSLNNSYDAKGSASAAETNAKAYTDSVEIGGRNLYKSTTPSVKVGSGDASISAYDFAYHGRTVTVTSGSPGVRLNNVIPETNVPYTISFTCTASVACNIQIDVMDNAAQYANVPAGTSKVAITSTPTRAVDSTYHFIDILFSAVGTYKLADIMVEQSNKASNWSLAPEDVAIERTCTVGQNSSTTTNPWYRVASSLINTQYVDNILIVDVYDSGGYTTSGVNFGKRGGRLVAHARASQGITSVEHPYLVWESRGSEVNLSDFVLAYKLTSGSRLDIELWCRCANSYQGYVFKVVYEGHRAAAPLPGLWVLYSSWSAGSNASITSGYTQVVSTDGSAAQETANANVKRTQRIYYRKAAAGAPSVPTAWVTNGSVESSWTKYNAWSTRVPPIADSTTSTTKYLYLYTCEQYETAGGTTPQYTTVLLDDSTTIIDGGNIITGSIATNRLSVYDATIQKIRADAIDTKSISIGDLSGSIGGRNLLRNTGSYGTWDPSAAGASDYLTFTDEYVKFTPPSSKNWWTIEPHDAYIPLDEWDTTGTYTVSLDVKVDNKKKTDAYIYPNVVVAAMSGKSAGYSLRVRSTGTAVCPSGTGWEHFEYTFSGDYSTWNSNSTNTPVCVKAYVWLYLDTSEVDAVYIRRLKLEKGSRSTDWSPAPEDHIAYVDDSINGLTIGGRNLWGKGSECTSLSGMTVSGFSIATESGYTCAHASGALKTTKTIHSVIPFTPKANEIVTISGYILVKNIVRGTTNPMCEFYPDGVSISGAWRAPTPIGCYIDGEYVYGISSVCFDNLLSDSSWHHVAMVYQWPDYDFSSYNRTPWVYFRDCTGDLYVRHLKFERGNKATDWTPAPEDVDASIAAAQSTANANVRRTQRIYYRTSASASKPNPPTAWLEVSTDVRNAWTTKVPRLTDNADGTGTRYPALYTCEQYQLAGESTPRYTPVLIDDSATVIDGGTVITGTLKANAVSSAYGTFDAALIPKLTSEHIDVGTISIGDLSGSIGGRNLFPGTEKLSWFATNASEITIVNGVATLPGSSSGWAYLHTPLIPFSIVNGNDITFSFEYKADKATYGYICTEGTASGDESNAPRTKYKDNTFNWPAQSEWTKWSVTFKGISLEFLSQGSGNVNYFRLAMYNRTDSSNFKIRLPKLEKGNKATDWTPAPEDQTAYVDSIQVGGRNYILDSAGVNVSGIGGGSRYEYRQVNLHQSYMGIPHGTQVTISFDLYMTVNTANPTLLVYNTNNKGPKAFSQVANGTGSSSGVTLSFTAAAGTVIDERVSVTGYINDRSSPTLSENWLEFYSTYDTSNWYSVSNLKLEKGNKATDWYPAPEDVNDRITYRGTCSTAAATAAKVVACPDFTLATGATVQVYCSTANTAAAPTLNINATGAKAIWVNGAVTSASNPCKWLAGDTVTFTYDGTRYRASLPVENFIAANSSGIKIANANPSTATTYQLQTASGTDFVVAGAVRNRVNSDGMTLYDGGGVADGNIVAKFASSLIELGKSSVNAVMRFCGGKLQLSYYNDTDRGIRYGDLYSEEMMALRSGYVESPASETGTRLGSITTSLIEESSKVVSKLASYWYNVSSSNNRTSISAVTSATNDDNYCYMDVNRGSNGAWLKLMLDSFFVGVDQSNSGPTLKLNSSGFAINGSTPIKAIYADTTVVTLTNGQWLQVADATTVTNKLGSGASQTNTICIAQNGDFNTYAGVVTGAMGQDGSARAYIYPNRTGIIRINFILIRFK